MSDPIRQQRLAIYDAIVADNPHFDRLGKTMPYTSANGYMFSQLNKDNELGIRLPKPAQEAFKKAHNATIFKSYGAVMKDYVRIPDHLFDTPGLIGATLEEGYQFVMSLPPK